MTSHPTHSADDVLVLNITRAADGRLSVQPSGTGIRARRFTIDAVLTVEEERHFRSYIEDFAERQGEDSEAVRYVTNHLDRLGERYYAALFGKHKQLHAWLEQALRRKSGRLVIVSDEQVVHRELWETLRVPQGESVAFAGVAIVRRLKTSEHHGARESQGRRLRVMLVPARPTSQSPTRTVSRAGALKQILGGEALDTCVPATLTQLKNQLADARHEDSPFSVVHFEGHGSHIPTEGRGTLFFEDASGEADAVAGDRLSQAFPDAALVVLEACQAAETTAPAGSWDAVAIRLVRSGVATVVATPFKAHIDQMERFIPAFYRALAQGMPISAAVGAGRSALLTDPRRHPIPHSAPVDLTDWWTIQLYQQGPDLSFEPCLAPKTSGQTPVVTPPNSGGTLGGLQSALSGRPMATFWARRLMMVGAIACALALLGFLARRYPLGHTVQDDEQRVRTLYWRCLNGNAHHCIEAKDAIAQYRNEHQDTFSIESTYWLGLIKEDGRFGQLDRPGALAAYEDACRRGWPVACLNHGHMAEHGYGLPSVDMVTARQDYERGCALGDLDACANAALLIVTSNATEISPAATARALELYTRACHEGRGIPRGCVGLGSLRQESGDIQGAYKWFSLACAKEDLLGCKRQGDLATDIAERRSSYRKACAPLDQRHGACSGCIPLARSYADEGSSEAGSEAFRYFEGLCYSGCSSSEPGALSCCQDREVQGDACFWLGWAYEFGKFGTRPNRAEADRAYKRSCTDGNRRGCNASRELDAL
jgi:TPR repeat protein